MTSDETQLWSAHETEPTSETRAALIAHYLPHVQKLAGCIAAGIPRWAMVDSDDVYSDAVIGLMRVIDSGKFDRARGVSFTTYSQLRIRGYVSDKLRELDWVPRLERLKQSRGEVTPKTMQPYDPTTQRGENNRSPFNKPDERQTAVSQLDDPLDTWREALKSCSTTERLILLLYYREGATMKAIGKSIGLTESRVSQLMSAVKKRLSQSVA